MTFLHLCVRYHSDDRRLLQLQRGLLRIDFALFGAQRKKNETLIALVAMSRKRRVINTGLQYAAVDGHVCCGNVCAARAQVISEIQG